MTVSKNLSQTVKKLKSDFVDCSDFLLRELELDGARLAIAAADGMIDSLQLSQMVVSPIINSGAADFDTVKNSVVNSVELNEADDYNDCLYYIQSGFAVVFFDGDSRALCCGIQAPPARSVDEPANESTVKAPKEAFTEVLNTDKALLRKRLKTPHLKLKQLKLGIEIPSAVVVAYMDDRADRELVSCVIEALREARLDSVGDYGQLVKYIDTDIKTVFSAVSSTERPDVVASKLLEGRVAVLVDGSPFALYAPSLFTDNFRSPDDYDAPPLYSAFIRILRYFSFVMSIFLPGAYVAIGTFHQELIPTAMLFTIAKEEITTPYSLMTEAVMLLVMYEIMREAGLRLPKAVGHAVSIIGGIVIGETTVSAGLIGAPMLVVIALTAISSYVVSPLYESVSVLRFVFIIIGGLTGMYGIIFGAAVLCVNMCAVNPYGVPYTSPVSPLDISSLGDASFGKTGRAAINRLRGGSIDVKIGTKK